MKVLNKICYAQVSRDEYKRHFMMISVKSNAQMRGRINVYATREGETKKIKNFLGIPEFESVPLTVEESWKSNLRLRMPSSDS